MKTGQRTTRRSFLKSAGWGAAELAACGVPAYAGMRPAAGEKASTPNFLFLFTDDQRFDTIHALNNPAIHTPNMDRLVREGTAFTHAHIMGSTCPAVCMPSRAMLMTGRSLFHLEGNGERIPAGHVMMPELLRRAGYATFGTGKWHNGAASYARSFSCGADIFFGGMSDHQSVPVLDFDPAGKYPGKQRHAGGEFSSELFSDAAIEFLRDRDRAAPFFAYVSYTAPHDPRMAPKAYADLYPPEKIALPPNFLPEHPFDNGELRIRDEMLAPFPRTPEAVREHIAAYYAMISHLDAQIGRVLDALEETGAAENTIVIFAGDNGLAVGQHGLLGKQSLYEHSVRVPLLFRGPGVPKGKTCAALCYLQDIYPTVCAWSGQAVPEGVEGRSLIPVMTGDQHVLRDWVFGAYMTYQRMVRRGNWKLICYDVNGKRTSQLFDMAQDPWEMHNLAEDPDHAARRLELMQLLKDAGNLLDDPCRES